MSFWLEVEKYKASLQVTNSKSKNEKFTFDLLPRKKFHFELPIREMNKKLLISNYWHSRLLCWNETLYNSELFEKNIGM